MPGPVPKKDSERRRRNKTAGSTPKTSSSSHIPSDVVSVVGEVEIPEPDPKWHAIATMIYDAQRKSGQIIWMEPSDWSMLYMLCESISRDMSPQVIGISEATGKPVRATIPLKGASLAAYLKGFEALLMAEGGRRRLRIELERQKRIDAAAGGEDTVPDVVQNRAALFAVPS